MTQDERILRQLVATGHGHGVYWDDGEMSDGSMHPFIDFLRDDPKDIQSKIYERNLIRVKQAGIGTLAELVLHPPSWSEP